MNDRSKAIKIFLSGVESVRPGNLINRFVAISEGMLRFDQISFDISRIRNLFVIGAGKASAEMAQALEDILGKLISGGHIVTKYGHSVPLKYIGITEAGHPVPDENGLEGTERILALVRGAGGNDLIICLISGGGSALLADVPDGCTLNDLKDLNSVLLKSGANINEINCIRKHLSKVKGGQLAKTAFPAKIISLILSDVVGDPLDVIASGPTAPDPSTFEDALNIIEKYDIKNSIPPSIYQVLQEGSKDNSKETLKVSDMQLSGTYNFIIGNNLLALENAKKEAEILGFDCRIISHTLQGDVHEVADRILDNIRAIKNGNLSRICLLFAGEPTVKVTGSGKGGRNQHLALLIADLIKKMRSVTFLSGGTDGSDGPTDATGAVVDCNTIIRASELCLNVKEYIHNNDSYSFFKIEGGLIKTGPTKTNVMDLMIALIGNE